MEFNGGTNTDSDEASVDSDDLQSILSRAGPNPDCPVEMKRYKDLFNTLNQVVDCNGDFVDLTTADSSYNRDNQETHTLRTLLSPPSLSSFKPIFLNGGSTYYGYLLSRVIACQVWKNTRIGEYFSDLDTLDTEEGASSFQMTLSTGNQIRSFLEKGAGEGQGFETLETLVNINNKSKEKKDAKAPAVWDEELGCWRIDVKPFVEEVGEFYL